MEIRATGSDIFLQSDFILGTGGGLSVRKGREPGYPVSLIPTGNRPCCLKTFQFRKIISQQQFVNRGILRDSLDHTFKIQMFETENKMTENLSKFAHHRVVTAEMSSYNVESKTLGK